MGIFALPVVMVVSIDIKERGFEAPKYSTLQEDDERSKTENLLWDMMTIVLVSLARHPDARHSRAFRAEYCESSP